MQRLDGTHNPNYRHGRHVHGHFCCDCGKKIDPRSTRCSHCSKMGSKNPFSGKQHTKRTIKKIAKASKDKFTEDYVNKNYRSKAQGNKKRSINGYILVKDYDHPNRNCHNDVLEHIKVMSEMLGRPIRKGEIVHHKNFVRDDNRRSNLYLYNNISEHGTCTRSIFELVDTLLKRKIIYFSKGVYKMNKKYNTGGCPAVVGGTI